MPNLNDVLAGSLAQAVQVQQIVDALKGTPSKGVPVALTALNDSANYALTVKNTDPTNSRALSVLKADGTNLITADVTGVTLGAPLNLPVGSVTGAMIQDGTIGTVDIAPNQVQQQLGQYFAAPSFSSTTTATWLATPVSIAATTAGGLLRIEMFTSISHSTLGGIVLTTIGINGSTALGGMSTFTSPGAGYMVPVSYTLYQTLSAGANTFTLYVYNNNAGTLTLSSSVASLLSITEQKR